MSNGTQAGGFSASITPTSNPLVANFTITIPANTQVTVEFGPDTTYGRSSAPMPAPPGGGLVSILVAGMLPSTTYHMRARIQWNDGRWLTTADQTFPTGSLPVGILPTLTAATAPGQKPSPGVELVNVIDPIGISVVSDLAGNIIWYYNNAADKGGSGDGTIMWKLGYQGDFTLTGDFTADTDWFFAQHFPHILGATGTQITSLSVMDNGNDRCFAMPGGCAATNPAPPPPFTRGAIFTIDETAMTASLAWQYPITLFGQATPVSAYSFWGGNVVRLQNGNIEICASEPVKVGTQPPQKDAPSQVIELTGPPGSPVTVWQMRITTGGTYRSYRLSSLYPGVTWKR